jgi:hypothetical protein
MYFVPTMEGELVNLAHVIRIERGSGGSAMLVLPNGHKTVVRGATFEQLEAMLCAFQLAAK